MTDEPYNKTNLDLDVICPFRYIDTLTALGRREDARELFENMLRHPNHPGLLSEDQASDGELWW